MLDDFTEDLNKIQNAQIDARKMTLNPPWKRLTATEVEMRRRPLPDFQGKPPRITATEIANRRKEFLDNVEKEWLLRSPIPNDTPNPLTEEIFNKYISAPPRMGPPYVTSGIKMFVDNSRTILGRWTWFDAIRAFFYKITRRLKVTIKREAKIRLMIREEIRRESEEHLRLKHQETRNLYLTEIDFGGGITLNEFIDKLLDHLGIALKTTPQKIELVSMKKSKKKAKSKTHKAKKRG